MELFAVEIKVYVNSNIEIWPLITKTMSQLGELHKLITYSILFSLHPKG